MFEDKRPRILIKSARACGDDLKALAKMEPGVSNETLTLRISGRPNKVCGVPITIQFYEIGD